MGGGRIFVESKRVVSSRTLSFCPQVSACADESQRTKQETNKIKSNEKSKQSFNGVNVGSGNIQRRSFHLGVIPRSKFRTTFYFNVYCDSVHLSPVVFSRSSNVRKGWKVSSTTR